MSVLVAVLLIAGRVETARYYLDVPVSACNAGALWWLPRLVPEGASPLRWRCEEVSA